ncbi:hypothetical protein, partial [Falsiroseomonas sp. CW058]|uniref:hypothetical protein n=1 Tax=Falsiroseomonas sp. CW058 TaxID=3388664 RepID=UPI003D321537
PPRPAAVAAATIRLPFAGAGAALLRGDSLLLVFEDNAEPDLPALRRLHPAMAAAELVEVPGATVLRLPSPAGLALLRDGAGWLLGAAAPPPPVAIARSTEGDPRLLLRAERPGRVVAVPDPLTDGLMLVGTLSGPLRATPAQQRFVAFDVLPTQAGVALALRSDEVVLRRAPDGFVVPLAPVGPLSVAAVPGADLGAGATIARQMWLHDMPHGRLVARWGDLQARIAAAPAQARGPLRLELAEALLSLGLGLEAQAAVQVAVADDPRLAGRPHALLLSGAAALLAGRLDEAGEALADPRLPPDGEAALWRGLAAAAAGEPGAAPAFRAAAPLLRTYPAPLRARLLPQAAIALAEAGEGEAAASLIAGDATVDTTPLGRFARARVAEAKGEAGPALDAYRLLAEGRDQDARARALGRMAELQLASGAADAAAAAGAMDRAIAAWRGDQRELSRRLRTAELRLEAGEPARALALLRETEALFPDAADALRDRLAAAVAGVIADPATPPQEATRLHAEHHATLPADPRIDAALARIADRLLALELPTEAATLLTRALDRGVDRAGLSLRLAEAKLADGDAAGALEALRATGAGAALPGEAGLRRALAEATARQRLGDVAGAAGVLRGLGPEGAPRLAELLAGSGDWAGAAAAMGEHLARTAPEAGALAPATRREVLRLGAFLTLAGDDPGLAALRTRFATRMSEGEFAEAFAAIAPPAPGGNDAAHLRREVARARAATEELRALR